jgi:hypothetical protein
MHLACKAARLLNDTLLRVSRKATVLPEARSSRAEQRGQKAAYRLLHMITVSRWSKRTLQRG